MRDSLLSDFVGPSFRRRWLSFGSLDGVSIMQYLTLSKVRQASGYATAGSLMVFVVMGLAIECSEAKPAPTNCNGYTLAIVLIAYGILTLIGVWLRYGGGLWSVVGCLSVGAAIACVALTVQVLMQDGALFSPVFADSITTVLWAVE